jgi:hypothetical protein
MLKNEWTRVADAPALIGAPDAAQRLRRAQREGTLRLRGVKSSVGPHTPEPVEIPSSEFRWLTLDISGERLIRLSSRGKHSFPVYTRVEVWTADVERLAREAKGATAPVSSPPRLQTPQSAARGANAPAAADESVAGKNITMPEAVASVLHRLFPDGRPAKRLEELAEDVREAAGENLGEFRLTTLRRAMVLLGWPMRPPKSAKPGQPSR